MKKKAIKKFSRTVLLGFFMFQFAIAPSLMPVVAHAQEVAAEEAATTVAAEPAVTEEVAPIDESVTEETSAVEEVVEFVGEILGLTDSSVSREETPVTNDIGVTTGSIEICKVIINANNEVVVGNEFAGETFSVKLKNNDTDVEQTFAFTAPLAVNAVLGGDGEYGMQCLTANDLPFGHYTYAAEEVSGPTLWGVTYTEGDINDPLGINQVQSWSYDANNTSSDGSIALGIPNEGLLTNVKLVVVNKFVAEGGDECTAMPVYARVRLQDLPGWPTTNKGYATYGTGNMAPQIFVGGTNPLANEDGGDVYDLGEWFLVYDPATGYVNDPELTDTDPGIQGLAVQRLNGAVRVVLYGSHTQPAGNDIANREMAHGTVDFSNDTTSVSSDVVITDAVIDAVNPPEINPGNPIEGPSNDWINFDSIASHFKFVVTTHNDGYYTLYTHTIPNPENCDDDGEDPTLVVNPLSVCILTSAETYDFMSGVSALDAEDGVLTGSVSNDGTTSVHFGTAGTYTVTYNVTDSDGNFAYALRTIFIKTNCDGGDNDNPPTISVIPPAVCILKTATSYNFMNGVTAVDIEDGILTGSVTNNGAAQVQFGVPGSYTVTYSVIDTDGNSASATRTIEIKINCGVVGSEDKAPTITVRPDTVCISIDTEVYDFMNGVTAFDPEDGDITGAVTNNGAIVVEFGTEGTYTVTYKVRDSHNHVAAATRTIYIKKDCKDEGGPSCDSPVIWARVIVSTSNQGNGNVTNTIYLGSTSNTVASGEWFDTSILDANPIGNFANVPGLAVQRLSTGAIVLELHGTNPAQTDLEYAEGYIEFFNGIPTSQVSATGQDILEDGMNGTYHDLVWIAGDKSYFDIRVNTADDRFTTNFQYQKDEDCDDGKGNDPVITVNPLTVCLLTTVTSYNFLGGVTATDIEDGNLTGAVTHNGSTGIFGNPGTYIITYSVTDSDGNSDTATRAILIAVDCNEGGGDDTNPHLSFPTQSCIETSATTFDFMLGVVVTDDEGAGQVTVTNNGATAVTLGTAGTYTVTYIATDSDGNTTTVTRTVTISENCGGTGGGDDLPPVITITGSSCIDDDTQSFNFLAGVTATDDIDGDLTATLNLTDNVLGEENVHFGIQADYSVTYTVTDSDAQTTSVIRTITISNNCDNGGGGGGGGNNGGGGNGGGGSGGSSNGEVLGASTSCAQFTQYHDTGDTQSEVIALQTFLNEYMGAGLSVNGTYDHATTQAIHNFQAMHWNEIIKPWLGAPSEINPNTTGRTRQTTMTAMNFIIGCPNAALYLEDPQIMYEITMIKDQKSFSADQMALIVGLLDQAHGMTPEGK